MAVSLGRKMQEPLHEFSSLLLSEEGEIFSLKMHPLQDLLPKVCVCVFIFMCLGCVFTVLHVCGVHVCVIAPLSRNMWLWP